MLNIKRRYGIILICLLIVILGFSIVNNLFLNANPEKITVSLRTYLKDDIVNFLEWKVENISEKRLVFEDGNINKYEIIHIKSKKVYTNKGEFDTTIILKPDEVYKEIIPIDRFKESGKYKVIFTAISKDGIIAKHNSIILIGE